MSLLLGVDRAFSDFSIQVKPEEARSFVRLSNEPVDVRVLKLVELIDAAIPADARGAVHPLTGRQRYAYRLGREVGKRVMRLELTKLNFPRTQDLDVLFSKIEHISKDNNFLVDIEDREHDVSIISLWI